MVLSGVCGDRSGTVVKVLCYKSEGRSFDPSWCQWIFHWHKNLPIALWLWGRLSLWQKWVPGAFPGGKGGRCIRLTTYHHPVSLWCNLGTLTSWNPQGHFRPVTGLLYLYLIGVCVRCEVVCRFVVAGNVFLLILIVVFFYVWWS